MTEEKKISEMEDTTEQAPEKTEEESAPVVEKIEPQKEEAPAAEETPAEKEAPAAEEAPEMEEEPEDIPNKKIRLMNLEEVEKKLRRSRLKMGGDSSLYIKHLLSRKAELEGGRELTVDG